MKEAERKWVENEAGESDESADFQRDLYSYLSIAYLAVSSSTFSSTSIFIRTIYILIISSLSLSVHKFFSFTHFFVCRLFITYSLVTQLVVLNFFIIHSLVDQFVD